MTFETQSLGFLAIFNLNLGWLLMKQGMSLEEKDIKMWARNCWIFDIGECGI
jgi:hypothetical protein